MRARWALCAVLALAAAGCDPLSQMYVRQGLQPQPRAECARQALEASPLVESVLAPQQGSGSWGYALTFRDTVTGSLPTLGSKLQADAKGSLAVVFSWLGTERPRAPVAARMQSVAAGALAAVRAACAPDAPPAPVECFYDGWHGRSACAAR